DSKNNELQLDYYFGKPTDHTRIPVGKGVCGSAIAEKTDKIIKDVREEDNYLACSLETRSEIVVLIESEDEIIGQIDVDSDDVGAFDEIDRNYLHKISEMMVKKLKAIE
ncbi:MAG: GAF domain-containing protein, partial [Candidatus Hodarchaeales archaeon]